MDSWMTGAAAAIEDAGDEASEQRRLGAAGASEVHHGDDAPERRARGPLFGTRRLSAASPDEIRSAYRQTARRLHTDVADQPDGGAMAAANAAWYVLRDSARRAEYDAARCSVDGAAHVPSVEPLDQWTPAPRRLPLVVFVTAILCVVVFALIFLIGFTQGPGSSG